MRKTTGTMTSLRGGPNTRCRHDVPWDVDCPECDGPPPGPQADHLGALRTLRAVAAKHDAGSTEAQRRQRLREILARARRPRRPPDDPDRADVETLLRYLAEYDAWLRSEL